MITTTHVLLNTTLLGRKDQAERNWPLVLGSILPDIPMALYGVFLVLLKGRWDRFSWTYLNESHYREFWVNWAHSIPLALAGLLLCWFLKKQWGIYFFAAMGLHDLEDIPVHSNYPHRHFIPLSGWRFYSPFSFTDPAHHAALGVPIELAIVLACVSLLWRRGYPQWVQVLLLFIAVFQGSWLVYYYVTYHFQ